jgi:hypothetical protein
VSLALVFGHEETIEHVAAEDQRRRGRSVLLLALYGVYLTAILRLQAP